MPAQDPPPPAGAIAIQADPPPPKGAVPIGQEQPGIASRIWSSFVSALPHPIDAIEEWANRPAEIGKAMDGLHELNQMEKQAKADPQNQGKPRQQWVWPQGTPEQQQKIAGAMSAQIGGSPEGNTLTDVAGPGVKGAQQMASGDVAGGLTTIATGYAVPAVLAAVPGAVAKGSALARAVGSGIADSDAGTFAKQVMTHPKVVAAIKDAGVELAKEVPGVKTLIKAGKVVGTGRDVINDVRNQNAAAPAATQPVGPPAPLPAEQMRTPLPPEPMPATPAPTVNPEAVAAFEAAQRAKAATTARPVGVPSAVPPAQMRTPLPPEAMPGSSKPPAAPPAAGAPPPATVNPAKAAFDAAEAGKAPLAEAAPAAAAPAAPQVTRVPAASESLPPKDFAAAPHAAKVGKLADALEGQIPDEDIARLKPADWKRLGKGLGIDNVTQNTIDGTIAELKTRAAAKAPPPAAAPTVMTPSLDYLAKLKNNPRALAIAQQMAAMGQ
jgi:hypothetical protein